LATEAISRIRRLERNENLFGLPEWHDDLYALCSAEINVAGALFMTHHVPTLNVKPLKARQISNL
jgi:hypothetical protein